MLLHHRPQRRQILVKIYLWLLDKLHNIVANIPDGFISQIRRLVFFHIDERLDNPGEILRPETLLNRLIHHPHRGLGRRRHVFGKTPLFLHQSFGNTAAMCCHKTRQSRYRVILCRILQNGRIFCNPADILSELPRLLLIVARRQNLLNDLNNFPHRPCFDRQR